MCHMNLKGKENVKNNGVHEPKYNTTSSESKSVSI